MHEESNLQSKILNDLRSYGKYCECFKIMKTSDNGEPDVFFTTALTGGVLLELKKLSGTPQEIQKIKIKKLNDCGTKTFICNSWESWIAIKKKLGIDKDSLRTTHYLLTANSIF